MIGIARRLVFSAILVATTSLALIALQTNPATAQSETDCDGPCPIDPSPLPTPAPSDGGSSGKSIDGLAGRRFNQMITNQVLGNVLLGVNEQINCSDCVSAFGSVGSFTAGMHGRKELTNNLSLLAGLAYTQYSEGGYHVTSAPIGAFALRYDFVDWGSSRPFFDVGAIASPFQKVRYSRSYATSVGAVSLDSSTDSSNYAVYGRAGWRRVTRSRAPLKSGSYGSASPATRIRRRRSTRSTPPSPPAPTAPIWSRSADSGRICSARAWKATSTVPSCSPLPAIRASSRPSPAKASSRRPWATRLGSNMAEGSDSALPRAGSRISSSTARPGRNRSATPFTAASDCVSTIKA
jgi:hypothetical protein